MTALASLAIITACVYLLIVVSNDFFIESLDQISAKLKLSPSVAGATLMAAGSSAPELAIALLALFTHGGAHSDMGIGTIVGSAVFNILVITGLCALVRPARITISAIVRDTIFYLASILLLVYVFADGSVTFWEPLLLMITYLVYLIALYYLPGDTFQEPHLESPPAAGLSTGSVSWRNMPRLINNTVIRTIRILAGNARYNYLRAFTVSIIAIVIISKLLVDYAIIFAQAIHLPPVIVALTVLACGTSAPDLISSVIVARRGHGDMAVANAIGSNIFDILIGLGLPWGITVYLTSRKSIGIGTGDLLESVFILIATVLVLFLFLYTNRQLGKKEGTFLLLVYAGYLLWTVAT